MKNKMMSKVNNVINNVNDEKVKLSNMFNNIIKQFDEKDVNEDILPVVIGYSNDEYNCGLVNNKKEIYNTIPVRSYYNITTEYIDSPNSAYAITDDFIKNCNPVSERAVLDGVTLFFQNRINYLLVSIINESEAIIYNWIHQCPNTVLQNLNIDSIKDVLYDIQLPGLKYNNNGNYDVIFLPKFYSNLDMDRYTLTGHILADTMLSLIVSNNLGSATNDITIMLRNYIVNRFVQIACQLNYEYNIILNNVIIPLKASKLLDDGEN